MITSINKIKNFGCYDEYNKESSDIPDFQKVNIFYGVNGSGKTTLSNLMFLLSKYCKDKGLVLKEYIDQETEIDISSSYGKITHKNVESKSLPLYVFNSKFINDHVFNGTKANVDDFSSEVKLTNEQIKLIEDRLTILHKRKANLEKIQNGCETKLASAWQPLSTEFQEKLKGPRLTGVKPTILDASDGVSTEIREELNSLYKEYELKNQESNTIEELLKLKNSALALRKFNIDFPKVATVLGKSILESTLAALEAKIEKFAKVIEERNKKDSFPDLNNWFKIGGRLLHLSKSLNSECPLCNTDLSDRIEIVLNEYTSYFSDELVNLQDFLDSIINTIEDFSNNKLFSASLREVSFIIESCLGFNISIETQETVTEVDFESQLQSYLNLLKQKRREPKLEILISKENTSILESFQNYVFEFTNLVIAKVDKKLSELSERKMTDVISEIKEKVKLLTILIYNKSENSVLVRSTKTNAKIAKFVNRSIILISDEEKQLVIKRDQEIAKLNAESKYVNIYLNHLGISNFFIEKQKEKSEDNLIITYQKSGKKKASLNHSLSEGEKTALAFAYFISKIRVEKLEGNTNGMCDCIIVIDDPISSLDDNRLFQTANLIDSFFYYASMSKEEHPCQLFLFSHNIVFVKYLYNAFKANPNLTDEVSEYYLSSISPRLRKIPSSLKNFTNTYLVKVKEIMNYKEKNIDYETAKNYLPNFIRIVLETFLSFKLALVNDSGKMPGLSHLIGHTINELKNIDDEIKIGGVNRTSVIKRLNLLKKISDHESHGNISRAEHFQFISEDELNDFAKYTLQIINFMDEIHFRRVKSLSA